MYSTRTYETAQLQEYEQKFRTLQEEVFLVLKQCREAQNNKNLEVDKLVNKEIQCKFDIINQSQQTEANDALNVSNGNVEQKLHKSFPIIDLIISLQLEEYVNLMEKENTLLKSGSFKQRQYIAQLSTEIVFLKNRLDYLEKDLQIKTEFERRKEMNEVAEKLYSPKLLRLEKDLSASSSRIRKKLFPEKSPSSSEFTSSNSKDDNSLTDELVAEAKNKLKELENESAALNKNFKNLQTVLSKNITFNEKAFSSSDSSSDRFSHRYASNAARLSPRLVSSNVYDCESNLKSSPDLKSHKVSFFNRKLRSETASPIGELLSSTDKSASFRRMYSKYKLSKLQERGVNTDDERQSEEMEAEKAHPNVDENLNNIDDVEIVEKSQTPSVPNELPTEVKININEEANLTQGR